MNRSIRNAAANSLCRRPRRPCQPHVDCFLVVVAALMFRSAVAATVTWSGAGPNDLWSTAGNWTGGPPTPPDRHQRCEVHQHRWRRCGRHGH